MISEMSVINIGGLVIFGHHAARNYDKLRKADDDIPVTEKNLSQVREVAQKLFLGPILHASWGLNHLGKEAALFRVEHQRLMESQNR